MKRILTVLSLSALALAAFAAPSEAQGRYSGYDNAFRFHGGIFEPDAESQYWDDSFTDFTGDAEDFEDFTGAIEYQRDLTGNLRLLVGGSVWEGQSDQAYRGFVDAFDNEIRHDTTLDIASATVGLAFRLAPKNAPIIPYVGGGGGLYAWTLEESGEFIDFFVDPPEIFPATFEDDGVAFGYFYMAGLEVPVTPDISIFGEGRWHRADDELEGDFDDLGEIDLSGRSISLGLSWKF